MISKAREIYKYLLSKYQQRRWWSDYRLCIVYISDSTRKKNLDPFSPFVIRSTAFCHLGFSFFFYVNLRAVGSLLTSFPRPVTTRAAPRELAPVRHGNRPLL